MTTQLRASTQAFEFDLTVNTDRQRSIKAIDLATALNEAEDIRQEGDDVALWRGSKLVGAATRFGALDFSEGKPKAPPHPAFSTPSPAALESLTEYVRLWRAYKPNAQDSDWYSDKGGRELSDNMHDVEQRAIRLCLGNDTRLPMERLHHDPRVYAVGDAMVVIASDIDDRDRAVGDLRGQGHHLLVVEIPRVG